MGAAQITAETGHLLPFSPRHSPIQHAGHVQEDKTSRNHQMKTGQQAFKWGRTKRPPRQQGAEVVFHLKDVTVKRAGRNFPSSPEKSRTVKSLCKIRFGPSEFCLMTEPGQGPPIPGTRKPHTPKSEISLMRPCTVQRGGLSELQTPSNIPQHKNSSSGEKNGHLFYLFTYLFYYYLFLLFLTTAR